MREKIAIFWFRRDLRLDDNSALAAALKSGLPVLPVFIFDPNILEKLKLKDDRRITFIYKTRQIFIIQIFKIIICSYKINNQLIIKPFY